MFCKNCGNKLEEDALFCTNCGARINENTESKERILDNDIQLKVKPTYKIGYMIFAEITILAAIICIIAPLILMVIMIEINSVGDGTSSVISLQCGLILLIILYFIWLVFRKAQYDNYSYDFYNTKVIYKDGFFNKTEKEIRYKHIREVVMRESFFQRFFNLGTIILYTNAETGYGNGIYIQNIENVNDTYKKIKEIIDN